jgi:hypothetical protein
MATRLYNMATRLYNMATWLYNMATWLYNMATWVYNMATRLYNMATWLYNMATWLYNMATWLYNMATWLYKSLPMIIAVRVATSLVSTPNSLIYKYRRFGRNYVFEFQDRTDPVLGSLYACVSSSSLKTEAVSSLETLAPLCQILWLQIPEELVLIHTALIFEGTDR